jgi:hypothetical protein
VEVDWILSGDRWERSERSRDSWLSR